MANSFSSIHDLQYERRDCDPWCPWLNVCFIRWSWTAKRDMVSEGAKRRRKTSIINDQFELMLRSSSLRSSIAINHVSHAKNVLLLFFGQIDTMICNWFIGCWIGWAKRNRRRWTLDRAKRLRVFTALNAWTRSLKWPRCHLPLKRELTSLVATR